MDKIFTFIDMLDDDYIISLANKGYLKRAKKDYENKKVEIELKSDNPLIVKVGDNEVVFNGAKAEEIICDCPDSKFCKHRIISILYLQNEYERGESDQNSDQEGDQTSAVEVDPEISKFIDILDDDYIISLANKGYLKRAKKDYENKKVEIELKSDNPLTVKVGDNEVVFNGAKAEEIICDCPDSKFCKHRIISILYLQNSGILSKNDQKREEEVKKDENIEEIYSDLLNFSFKELQKYFSKSNFQKGIKYFLKTEISYENTKKGVVFSCKNVIQNEVYKTTFLPIDPLDNNSCTCKTKKCVHQVASILHFLLQFNKIDKNDLEEQVAEALKEIDLSILSQIEDLLYEIFSIGISKISDIYIVRVKKLAFKIHYESPALEKLLYSIEGSLKSFINRDVEFSVDKLRFLIVKTLKMIKLYKGDPTNHNLVRELTQHRSQYYEISKIELFGLGKEYREYTNGNVSLKLFFGTTTGLFYTRSIFLNLKGYENTGYYNKFSDPRRVLLGSAIWGDVVEEKGEHAIDSFIGERFILSTTKVNDELALSSIGKPIFTGKHNFENLQIEYGYKDIKTKLINYRREGVKKLFLPPFYQIIKVSEYGDLEFIYEKQEMRYPIYDQNGDKIVIQFRYKGVAPKYQKEREILFDNLKKIFKNGMIKPDIYFGAFHIEDQTLFFNPISIFYSGIQKLMSVDIDGFWIPQPKKKGKKKDK